MEDDNIPRYHLDRSFHFTHMHNGITRANLKTGPHFAAEHAAGSHPAGFL
ncbi:hypothetical protein [Jeotgalicoccus aerolatus]|nr:hypothetical protein [Jeotgalicoccus aerolatus]